MATTSGTTSFNFDLVELIEEAYERAGIEVRTGYEFRTARRSLNMMTIEWANRGINLWTVDQGQIVMNTNQAAYPLPADTIDLMDQIVRTQSATQNQVDINITRISESTYSTIPTKLAMGRPIQVWVNRQTAATNSTTATLTNAIGATDTTIAVSDVTQIPAFGFINVDSETILYQNVDSVNNLLLNVFRGQNNTTAASHAAGATIVRNNVPCINVWPTPNAPGNQYIFVYWRMRRMQDAGNGTNIEDIPFRLIPCMAAGLAFHIASKRTDVPNERVMFLKSEYEAQWQLAAEEDRNKAPERFVPRQMFY
jgi:hypothetical protein